MFNGSLGRLELEVVESSHRDPKGTSLSGGFVHGYPDAPNRGEVTVKLQRLWEPAQYLDVVVEKGDHGGGDLRMLDVIFGPVKEGAVVDGGDASLQSANERDGALALAVGLMANESFKTGKFVKISDLGLPL